MNALEKLIEANRYEDVYKLARFMYRIGSPIMNDSMYDDFEKLIKDSNLCEEYTIRTYDDDPIPYELLQEFDLLHLVPNMAVNSKYAKDLDEEKSLSIKAVTSYKVAFELFNNFRGLTLIASVKMDGLNSKSLYVNDLLEVSLSRARSGNGFDYTQNICKVLPTRINTNLHMIKVYSESFVETGYLDVLRQKYNGDFKTEKSAAISLLRVARDESDYKHVRSIAFAVDGIPGIKTKQESFEKLKELGFDTVPYFMIDTNDIPTDYEEFVDWLDNMCETFYKETEMYPSDGLVIEVNNLTFDDQVTNQYSNRNFALKLSCWEFKLYHAVVERILLEQKKVYKSCRVVIKPFKTKDGCDAKFINGFNPRILIDNKINVGSVIPFVRNSGAVNILVRGDNQIELSCKEEE